MIQNNVFLEPLSHRYFNRDTGEELISWSKFIGLFSPQFDFEGKSKMVASKRGVSAESIQKEWKDIGKRESDYGTHIHSTLEYYANNFKMPENTQELEPMVVSIQADYREYNKVYSEECLYTKYGIAGTCDKLFKVTSHANSAFDLEDFKNFKDGIETHNKYGETFKYPLEHLTYSKLNKATLQLSGYAFMVQELTGKKIRNLWFRYLPRVDRLQHVRLCVPYLKNDIQLLLNEFEKLKQSGKFVIAQQKEAEVLNDNPTF